jgi:hypothetical protein
MNITLRRSLRENGMHHRRPPCILGHCRDAGPKAHPLHPSTWATASYPVGASVGSIGMALFLIISICGQHTGDDQNGQAPQQEQNKDHHGAPPSFDARFMAQRREARAQRAA